VNLVPPFLLALCVPRPVHRKDQQKWLIWPARMTSSLVWSVWLNRVIIRFDSFQDDEDKGGHGSFMVLQSESCGWKGASMHKLLQFSLKPTPWFKSRSNPHQIMVLGRPETIAIATLLPKTWWEENDFANLDIGWHRMTYDDIVTLGSQPFYLVFSNLDSWHFVSGGFW